MSSPPKAQWKSSLEEVEPAAWDRLRPSGFPFASHGFLVSMERAGAVGAAAGWIPRVLTLTDEDRLRAASLIYEKNHSYGEYIFDWGWAQAYERHGLAYYPKWVSAVPFTPATGPKLLGEPELARRLVREARAGVEASPASSLHYLFVPPGELALFEAEGFIARHSFQYHWHNRGYRDFKDFLDALKSRKRKQIVRERREIAESNLEFVTLRGEELTARHADIFFRFYRATIEKMGAIAYLSRECFQRWFEEADGGVLMLARRQGREVAASLLFEGGDTLYGRYWGATEEIKHLHFEMCYYRPMEYALSRGLARFEAGAQGEHKIARGFVPTLTYSAHWIRHPEFARAIGEFVGQEREAIARYFEQVRPLLPYR